MKFEVLAKILEMRDGIPTKLVVEQLDGRVYLLEGNIEAIKKITVKEEPKIGTVEEQLLKKENPEKETDFSKKVSQGKTIATIKSVPIKEPLLAEIKKRGISGDYEKILKEAYPSLKRKSIVKYNWAYRKLIGDYIKPRKEDKRTKKTYKKKYNKKNYNKKYGVIVKDDDKKKVLESIEKATLPTTKKLMWVTKMSSWKVRAVIDQLKNEGKVVSKQVGTSIIHYLVK